MSKVSGGRTEMSTSGAGMLFSWARAEELPSLEMREEVGAAIAELRVARVELRVVREEVWVGRLEFEFWDDCGILTNLNSGVQFAV